MNLRSAKTEMDAMRRKGTSLLRDWGECPDCGVRGSLSVSVPPAAGTLVVGIACDPRCGMQQYYPTRYVCWLGSIADRVRAVLEVEAEMPRPKTVDDMTRRMGEILREKAEKEARIFGISWKDIMGR